MQWTPEATIRQALWIGGGQWAGKTTVSALFAGRYGLTHYHHDAHDARAHDDRRIAARIRRNEAGAEAAAIDWEEYWIEAGPRETANRVLAGFPEAFGWILDDLRALVSPYPIVAEGWG